jgi:integrase
MPKTPSYITKNRFGIYSFQVRLPLAISRYNPNIKPLIRFTLKTCERAVAVRLARRKVAVLDAIKTYFIQDAKSAGRAVELWLEYENLLLSSGAWNDVELFIANLDDGDRHLFDMILDFNDFQEKQTKLIAENNSLKQSLASLQGTHVANHIVYIDDENNIALANACIKFLNAKVANDSAKSSVVAYKFAVNQFVNIVSALATTKQLNVSEISKGYIRSYVDLMLIMPKNPKVNTVTKNMSDTELVRYLSVNSKQELINSGVDLLAPKTVNGRFTIVREFVRYIEEQQYPIPPNLDRIIKFAGKGGEKTLASRRSFNDQELKLLFESENYRLCKFTKASDYWVPLLALFSGATQGELLQLHTSDAQLCKGTWVIDINDNAEKRLKTKDGRPRQIPVHEQLIHLGFDRFIKKCQDSKQLRLFPEEVRNDRDQFSSYSKRFNNYRRKVGVGLTAIDKVDFHSFRHLVSGRLIGLGVEEGVVNDIIGHASSQRSESRKTYSEGAFIAIKEDAIKKLKYEIDFNYIKFWR